MLRIYCIVTVVSMLLGIAACCADREQMYQGVYQSFSTVHESRMTEDPSYDPVQARDQNVPTYQEYKRDLKLLPDENTTPGNGNKTE